MTSPGYKGRVHAKIVFEQFNGMTERDIQAYIWDELKEDAQAVSLALAYGTDEL